jgi:CheY-like chemotaxis protein
MVETDAKDRRQVRLRVKKDVVINNAVKGYILDISEGGAFIYTQIPFPKGRVVELSFALAEGQEPLRPQGCVQFVQEGVGVGVGFIKISEVERERLKRFIEENLDPNLLAHKAADSDTRKKILIVDDSPAARTTYKNKLALMGFMVREASSGLEAIKAIENEMPDLMLLDLQMEGMDGGKLLQLLRSSDKWKNIKVVVLSGRITPQEAERIWAFKVLDILPKMTTTPNKLAERVKEILGK